MVKWLDKERHLLSLIPETQMVEEENWYFQIVPWSPSTCNFNKSFWYMPLTPTLRRLEAAELGDFKSSLVYIASSDQPGQQSETMSQKDLLKLKYLPR